MKAHMARVLQCLEESAERGEIVQLHHVFKACTSDVIATYAFGQSFGFLERADLGRPYFEGVNLFFGMTHIFGHFTWFADLLQSLPAWAVNMFVPSLRELWSKQSWWLERVREIRNSPNPERIKSTIFEGILNSSLPEEDKTDARLAAESQLIVFAGEGTTAYTLTAAVYELLAHPRELAKLRAELIQAIPDEDEIPSFSQIDSLPYFNAVINEVVRIHPGVMNRQPRISPDLPLVYRNSDGIEYVLPPGTLTTMSPLSTHMNSNVFQNPYKFLPQRWIDNPKIARAFLGFSRGARSCLGYDLYRGQTGKTLELYDTERARDIDPNSDKIIPVPAKGSKGLRIYIPKKRQNRAVPYHSRPVALHSEMGRDNDRSADASLSFQTLRPFHARDGSMNDAVYLGSLVNNTQAERKPQIDYPGGANLFFIVAALVLSVFLSSLDITIVATAIPKITDEFRGLDKATWYGSAFFLTSGSFQAFWGKVYKYFPLKWTFITAIFFFELGSLLCGVAPNSDTLIIGRAIAGMGCAGMATGGYTIIALAVEPRKRPAYTGLIGLSYCFASVLGPLVGGAITQSTDLVGVALIMGALVAQSLAMQYGGQSYSWNSSMVVGLLVGFGLIIVAFFIWERYSGERAIMPLRLLSQRHIAAGSAFAFLFPGSYYLVIYWLPVYFQSVGGANPIMSGVYTLPLILTATIAVVSAGLFITKTGLATPVQVASAAVAVVGSGLLYTIDIGSGTGNWIGYQIIAAVGWGAGFQIPVIIFFLNAGGGLLLNSAQAAFVKTLLLRLPISAPGVDPGLVVRTGATEIRHAFPASQVPGILMAYMAGIKVAFAIALTACSLSFIVGFLGGWSRLDPEAVKNASAAA
ncbi:hypothetical protein SLS63_008708 [Diaporthe eres]|uniref:Major facilitator superfamily (MFS) profile domain-containing protein n=1 Tax=Diaporthe eres TaxID=83184 RepID=A0ABR1P1Z7_DIAER